VTSFCGSCGTKLAGEFCAICGTRAGASSLVNTVAVDRAGAQLQQLPGNNISEALVGKWNWGAFFLSPFWAFSHRLPLIGIGALLCGLLSGLIFPAIMGLGIAIYLGVEGNKLAVKHRVFESEAQFILVQRAWTHWGIGVVVVISALYFLYFLFGVLYLMSVSR
jgi:hypothetical protein